MTPRDIIADLNRWAMANNRFLADPCPAVDPRDQWGQIQMVNGLKDWLVGPHLWFCNPPYGHEYRTEWAPHIHRMATEGRQVIALVRSGTASKAWQLLASSADQILFPTPRLRFRIPGRATAKAGAPFDSTIFGWNLEAPIQEILPSVRGEVRVR